jgi:hypothetical protein
MERHERKEGQLNLLAYFWPFSALVMIGDKGTAGRF